MNYVVVTPPSQPLLTLDEGRDHLRIFETDRIVDAQIGAQIDVATAHVENWVRRSLVTRTYDVFLRYLTSHNPMPRPPLISVDEFEFVDRDDQTQTMDPALYVVDSIAEPGAVIRADGQIWPLVSLTQPNPIRIRITAGYGHPSDVPPQLSRAALLHLENQHDHSGTSEELRMATEALMGPHLLPAGF